jgi:hypothetical protein
LASTNAIARAADASTARPNRLFFTSQGRTAIVNADGTGLRYFDFDVPGQATWQPGPSFPDGQRVIFLSMEPRRDGPGKPFEEYYTQTPTHLWLHDLNSGSLTELCTKDRMAPFVTPALLMSDERLLVQVVRNKVGQIMSVKLDGSEHRVLTTDQACWFGATYGSPKTRGGGSNIPAWTRDGAVLVPRRLPGSKVPWEHQNARPDVDHFNRDFKPELARGGTQICRIEPADGKATVLTTSEPQTWDFRGSQSSDGKHMVYCRAPTGEGPSLYVANPDGSQPRLITRGRDDMGADHPRWL